MSASQSDWNDRVQREELTVEAAHELAATLFEKTDLSTKVLTIYFGTEIDGPVIVIIPPFGHAVTLRPI